MSKNEVWEGEVKAQKEMSLPGSQRWKKRLSLRTGKSFISEDFWLGVSVIGGIRGISDQPIFSNSNDLRNIGKAVDKE
jgi:hypothetical protein